MVILSMTEIYFMESFEKEIFEDFTINTNEPTKAAHGSCLDRIERALCEFVDIKSISKETYPSLSFKCVICDRPLSKKLAFG